MAGTLLVCAAIYCQPITVQHLEDLEYPPIAAQAQIEGKVEVECVLDADGRVEGVEARSGHPILAGAARENAARWTFRIPGGMDAGSKRFVLVYNFRLEGVCHAPHCRRRFMFDSPNTVTVIGQARHWNPKKVRGQTRDVQRILRFLRTPWAARPR